MATKTPAAKTATPKRKPKPKIPPPLNPWDRQTNETQEAWEAFSVYRDMGLTRSTPKVAKQLGKSLTLITRWSSRHQWVLRASGFDREVDRDWQLQMAEARRTTAQRNARVAGAVMAKVVNKLNTLTEKDLSTADVARLMDSASRLEQLALGMPTANVQVSGPDGGPVRVDMTVLTDEERTVRLRTLYREIGDRLEKQETSQ